MLPLGKTPVTQKPPAAPSAKKPDETTSSQNTSDPAGDPYTPSDDELLGTSSTTTGFAGQRFSTQDVLEQQAALQKYSGSRVPTDKSRDIGGPSGSGLKAALDRLKEFLTRAPTVATQTVTGSSAVTPTTPLVTSDLTSQAVAESPGVIHKKLIDVLLDETRLPKEICSMVIDYSIMSMSETFQGSCDGRWGVPGDPKFSELMQAILDKLEIPESRGEYLKILHTIFKEITGEDLDKIGRQGMLALPKLGLAEGNSRISPSYWTAQFTRLADKNYPSLF